jgi:hypothetical protein
LNGLLAFRTAQILHGLSEGSTKKTSIAIRSLHGTQHELPGPARNAPGTHREHHSEPAGNPPGTCQEPAGNLPGTRREPTANLPGTRRGPAGNPPGTRREPAGNPPGTCRGLAENPPKQRMNHSFSKSWLICLYLLVDCRFPARSRQVFLRYSAGPQRVPSGFPADSRRVPGGFPAGSWRAPAGSQRVPCRFSAGSQQVSDGFPTGRRRLANRFSRSFKDQKLSKFSDPDSIASNHTCCICYETASTVKYKSKLTYDLCADVPAEAGGFPAKPPPVTQ